MLGNLNVAVRATVSEWTADVRAIQREGREMEKTFKPITQLVGDMGKAMTSAGKVATAGLTLPIVAMGAFAVKNFNESAKAAALMENAIRSTGGAAGKASGELKEMATALESNSLFGDDEIIQKVITQLLTFTNVAGTSFDRGAQAALNMSTVLGQDLQSSAIQVGKALNDPIAGVTALQRVGVKLTESQKDLVKSFMESGDIMGAQNVILQELEKEFGNAAKAASEVGAGPMTVLWNRIGNLTESWGQLISEAMVPFIDMASRLVTWLNSMDESTKRIILVVGALAAAVGPVLLVLGFMASSVSSIIVVTTKLLPVIKALGVGLQFLTANPIGITIVAVGALVAAIIYFRKEISGALLYGLSLAVSAFGKFIGVAARLADAVGMDGIANKLGEMKFSVEETAKSLDQMSNDALRTTKVVKDEFIPPVNTATFSMAGLGDEMIETGSKASKFAEEAKAAAEKAAKAIKDLLDDNVKNMGKHAEAVKGSAEAWMDVMSDMLEKDLKYRMDLMADTLKMMADLAADSKAIFVKLTQDRIDAEQDMLEKGNKATLDRVLKGAEDEKKARLQALEDVKKSAGEIFDAMFVKGESVFKNLTNLLKGGALSLGRAIFQDVTAELLGPVKKAFNDFFKSLLESTGLKSFISGLGAKIGGALSGIFGGGGGGVPVPTPTTGGGGLSKTLSGLASNPITWIAGAAAGVGILVNKFVGQGRKTADQFVREFQDPFGDMLGNLVDSFNAANAAGTLTAGEAEEGLNAVEVLWKTFREEANTFAKQGENQAKVVTQAFNTLDPLMAQIFTDMNADVKRLRDAVVTELDPAIEGTTMSTDTLVEGLSLLVVTANEAITSLNDFAESITGVSDAARTALEDLRDAATSTGGSGGTSGPPTLPGPGVPPSVVPPGPAALPGDPFWNNIAARQAEARRMAQLRESGRIPPGFESGLDRVPYTMPVIVHRNEAILNAGEAASWRAGQTGSVSSYAPTFNIQVHESRNPQATAREVVHEVERLLKTNQGTLGKTVRGAIQRPSTGRLTDR